MIPLKPFYMIRHGQSEANVGEFTSGHKDVALTPLGREQAKAAQRIVEKLSVKPQVIFHSHLSRARDTAKIINEVLDLEMLEIQDIAEQHFGEWEGKPYTFSRRRIHSGEDPPGGESLINFSARVARGISSVLSYDKSPPLIVCHGGVYRGFSSNFGFMLSGVANCVLYEFTPAPGQDIPWKIKSYFEDGAQEIAL